MGVSSLSSVPENKHLGLQLTVDKSYVEDVKFVINLDYPSNSEDYVHRIGRTGRSQRTGTAYAFFTPSNAHKAADLIQVLEEAKQVVNPKLYELSRNPGLFKRGRFGGRNSANGPRSNGGRGGRGGGGTGGARIRTRDSGDRGRGYDRSSGANDRPGKWGNNNGNGGSNYNMKSYSQNSYGNNSSSNSYNQNGNSYGSSRNGY